MVRIEQTVPEEKGSCNNPRVTIEFALDMKKITTGFFLCLTTLLIPLHAEEQPFQELPAILIGDLENLTGQDQFNVLAGTVTETLLQTLRLSGNFRVSRINKAKLEELSEQELLEYSQKESFDNLVYGEMDLTEQGEIRFTLSLYNPVEDIQIARVVRTSPGILSVFETSDELILSLLSSFSDRHWGFGSLVLKNRGLDSVYSVYLNNIPLGDSVTSLDRVLIGDYKLEIKQLRFGSPEPIETRMITIPEGETLTVEFAVPDILPREQQILNETYDRIVGLYTREVARDEVPYELRILSYLQTFPFTSEQVQKEITRFADLKDRWMLNQEWWTMEEESASVTPENIENSLRIFRESSSENKNLRQEALLNGKLYCAIRRMQAITALDEKDLDRGYEIYQQMMETAEAFGSPSRFGYLPEFERIRTYFEKDSWGDRRKRRKILAVLSDSRKMTEKFLKETRDHKLLILTDFERSKTRVNLSRERLPFLDENYWKSTVTVDGQTRETNGNATIFFLPDWEQDARYLEGRGSRLIETYQFTLGMGGGSWGAAGILWRLHEGRIGLKPSLETRLENISGNLTGIASFPVETDYFFFINDRWDLYGGIVADLTDTLDFSLFPRAGLSLGTAYLGKRETWYLDHRIFVFPEIQYRPQLGIRY